MAAVTPPAESAIREAQGSAGESTDMIAYAIVHALEAVALEIAALREQIAATRPEYLPADIDEDVPTDAEAVTA